MPVMNLKSHSVQLPDLRDNIIYEEQKVGGVQSKKDD